MWFGLFPAVAAAAAAAAAVLVPGRVQSVNTLKKNQEIVADATKLSRTIKGLPTDY